MQPPYADQHRLSRRLFACLLDDSITLILICLGYVSLSLFLLQYTDVDPDEEFVSWLRFLVRTWFISVAVVVLLHQFMEPLCGTTSGKWMLGCKTVSLTGTTLAKRQL